MNAQFEAIIKQYLDARAAEDPQFAEKYGNPQKSVTECCKYIVGEAAAKSNCGMAAIPDAEVYGWAVHYYDEENITIRECGGLRDVTPPAPLTDEQKAEAEAAAVEAYKAQRVRELAEAERKRKEAEAKRRKEQAENEATGDLFGV